MQITVRLFAIAADANTEEPLALADGATVADALAGLDIGGGEAYLTLINETSVPMVERAARVLNDGDMLTVFPPIKGG